MARHFAIPAVTAIVADGEGGEPASIALAELTEAMVKAGVPRGRMFVLLTGEAPPDAATRERARELRDMLGVPVIPHDPSQAAFEPGRLSGGVPLALEDELREAEAVVVCGRFGADARGRLHGGPAALLPGLAAEPTRAALAAELLGAPDAPARARAAFDAAMGLLEFVPVDFALVWDSGDPPAVRAGEGRAVFTTCAGEGWTEPKAAAAEAGGDA
jgi:hypothetical protein